MDPHIFLDKIKNMTETQKLAIKICLDFICLLIVGIPLLVFFYAGKPYKRGFYCSDSSIHYPFKDSTVTSTVLYLVGIFLPFFTMVGVEMASHVRWNNGSLQLGRRVTVGHKSLPLVLVRLYRLVGWFLAGAASQQLAVDVAKYSIGRLRPHFIELCRPAEYRPGNPCINPILYTPDHRDCYLGTYIENFVCCPDASVATPHRLKEIRLSFPSGHSSFSFYTMVYLALYLYYMPKRFRHRLLIPVFQTLVIGVAWFTALSRISNYKHHPTDVLGGTIIGLIVLALVVKVGKPFQDIISLSPPSEPPSANGELQETPVANL